MVDEVVQELQGTAVTRRPEPEMASDLAAFVPDEYVADRDEKLDVYRRMAGLTDLDALEALRSELRDRFMSRMYAGEWTGTMALTEPSGGSDLQNMKTTAIADGTELVINGSKTWISNARRSGLISTCAESDTPLRPVPKTFSGSLSASPGLAR